MEGHLGGCLHGLCDLGPLPEREKHLVKCLPVRAIENRKLAGGAHFCHANTEPVCPTGPHLANPSNEAGPSPLCGSNTMCNLTIILKFTQARSMRRTPTVRGHPLFEIPRLARKTREGGCFDDNGPMTLYYRPAESPSGVRRWGDEQPAFPVG